ncbi:MAG: hypothetical protein ACREA4_11405, partial [Nitrososphaera sp.]
GDGCSSTCTTEAGYDCSGEPSVCCIFVFKDCFDLGSGDTNCIDDGGDSDNVDSNNALPWDETEDEDEDCEIDNEELRLSNDCMVTRTTNMISTLGFSNIHLLYLWGAEEEDGGDLIVDWRVDSGAFNLLNTHTFTMDIPTTTPEDELLPGADNTTIDIRFTIDGEDEDDRARVDNVVVCGDLIPAAECGDGEVEGDEECDDGNTVNGDCCSDTCQFETGACNDSNACTTDEMCSSGVCGGGTPVTCNDSNVCTIDTCAPATGCVFTPGNAGTVCNTGSGDSCDPDETCDGVNAACPADVFKGNTFVCNEGSGDPNGSGFICDPDELCPGTPDQACPTDTFSPGTIVCNAGSGDPNGSGFICDPSEVCPGTAGGACPTDTFSPGTIVCNAGSG